MAIQLSDHFNYKRLLKFVFPSIIMMVFTSIYGVVDGLFVSNIVGKAAFAAINLIMPVDMIFGGIGFMLGTGGSALVAKTLGEKEPEKANRYFTMMILITVIIGVIISAIGIGIMRPVSIFLGADEAMLPNCILYGRIMMAFNVSFMLQNAFQGFLITAEKPSLGLAVTVIAGITNMVLDALFIGVFHWGVAGAAFATGVSQCVGGLIPLFYFLRPNRSLLRLVKTKLEIRPIVKACVNGSSEMVSSVTSSVVGILYNFQLLKYAGQNGVASYGVLMYVQFTLAAIFIGYSMGIAPVIGYHYGADNHSELKNLLKKSTLLMVGIGGIMVLNAEVFAVPLAKIFVGYDMDLLNMTVHALRISSLAFLITGFNVFASSFFTALNNGGISAAISFLRTFIFKFATVLILPLIVGLDGIWWADVSAEIFAFLLSIIFLVTQRKKYHYF
ncbi:MATE family efflux transporter [Faecalicatena acetigenes]|uniref:Multidrug export protein MepA n=1 Tax=Faecalicatena acetigenes TaxID=2981790 RepID=A0ABT2TCX1_9FIRM|nr:MATE family efflux transporter [Faecalicatena acetigenes]MCU6747717.1 MATE family efflux transporter [Faecalicatena acetigenes]SCI04817.1 Staphylococcal virulence regulator protein A [uncultured Clostridium sp.]